MDSEQILTQVNTVESIPGDWLVFPLQRRKVIIGIFGWIFGAFAGGLLFAFMAPIMIPHNYLNGAFSAVLSTIILGVVLYVCLGSIWAMITDIMRIREADKHLIIITPEDFVKQEGKKTVHVPLQHVKHVTVRGAPRAEPKAESEEDDAKQLGVGASIGSLFIGRRAASGLSKGGLGRRRSRTPTTIAFIDGRTDKEILVVNDTSYGDPHEIAASLKEYAQNASVQ